MLFQWYLFVFLIILYAVARAGNQRYQVYVAGEYEGRYKWFTALAVIAVLTYVAGTRDMIGDTKAYVAGYMNTPERLSDIPAVIGSAEKDPGFQVLNILLKSVLGDNWVAYLTVISGFCMVCVFSVYRKHSSNFFMTTFLFIASGEYVQWTHNGMRQFIAVAMVFAATDLLLNKRYIPYFLVVLFASVIHATALIMIPMCFVIQGKPWNYKTIFYMLAVVVAVSSVDTLTNAITGLMENSQYEKSIGGFLESGGTTVFRVLVFCIPPMLSLVFRRWLPADDPLVNLSINASVASMGIYIISMFTSGMFIGRIPVYFSLYNYMLLPWIIERVFEKRSAKLAYMAVIACYMYYYYYQMHVVWKLVK